MEPTRQQIVDDVIRDAHEADERIVTREVARRIIDELHALEGSGARWIGDLIDSLAETGAQKLYADWRRRQSIRSRTRKGTEVDIPIYGAVREQAEDGSIVYTQLALFTMTLAQVVERRDQLARQRDTLSAEVRFFADLAEIMEADPSLKTAGEALARLEAA